MNGMRGMARLLHNVRFLRAGLCDCFSSGGIMEGSGILFQGCGPGHGVKKTAGTIASRVGTHLTTTLRGTVFRVNESRLLQSIQRWRLT